MVVVHKYCCSVIIDEKRLKASSCLSIGYSDTTSCKGRDSQLHSTFLQISFKMKIAKKKIKIKSTLLYPKLLKKGEYIEIKCHNTLWHRILWNWPLLLWRRITIRVARLERQPFQGLRWPKHQYSSFTERVYWCLLTSDTKVTFNQAALDIGIYKVNNFNKVLAEMTKHAFPAYASCKQKRYLHRHLVKPRSMKLCSFISRLQELNAYLEEFLPDTKGQETAHLPVDEIMNIIYHSMPITKKNKMIEHGFNYWNDWFLWN